jgi:phosphatidylethanolamine/phosphatidyl-N-methylethanolamine N-methyltransferase
MHGTAEHALMAGTPTAEAPALETSRRGYRQFAPLYDLVFGASLQHGRRVAVQALECRPGEKVIELGVGSGLSLPLYPPDTEVVGIDLSQEMLAIAERRLQRLSAHAPRTLLAMNAEHLEFEDASFDKAVVLYAIAGLPDPVSALRELRRVCRPGATLVIVNRFSGRWRLFDVLLAPLYRLLSYRVDLDGEALVAAAGLTLLRKRSVNLFGYSSVLVCRT